MLEVLQCIEVFPIYLYNRAFDPESFHILSHCLCGLIVHRYFLLELFTIALCLHKTGSIKLSFFLHFLILQVMCTSCDEVTIFYSGVQFLLAAKFDAACDRHYG
jgi:hypothetical protein